MRGTGVSGGLRRAVTVAVGVNLHEGGGRQPPVAVKGLQIGGGVRIVISVDQSDRASSRGSRAARAGVVVGNAAPTAGTVHVEAAQRLRGFRFLDRARWRDRAERHWSRQSGRLLAVKTAQNVGGMHPPRLLFAAFRNEYISGLRRCLAGGGRRGPLGSPGFLT